MSKTALIIFVKNPALGKVKTRLAKTLGNQQALNIYNALLVHTRNQCVNVDCDRYVYYSQFIDQTDDWLSKYFQKRLQSGKDLGERMIHAFNEVLAQHERAIVIGSDCASLTSELIQHAIDALMQHDFVVGPAKDGGYYLLGLNRPLPSVVFENIEWSTDKVFSTTIERIKAINADYTLLAELSDIDTEADWKNYGWQI